MRYDESIVANIQVETASASYRVLIGQGLLAVAASSHPPRAWAQAAADFRTHFAGDLGVMVEEILSASFGRDTQPRYPLSFARRIEQDVAKR